jgi:hypothetical protein
MSVSVGNVVAGDTWSYADGRGDRRVKTSEIGYQIRPNQQFKAIARCVDRPTNTEW